MQFQDIAVEREPPLAIVKLNRPEVRNAVRPQTAKDLMKAFKQLEKDVANLAWPCRSVFIKYQEFIPSLPSSR